MALLLFIVTDSRSVKYIAQNSLETLDLSYESIEGNLFNGLDVKKLKYKDKLLLDSVLIYWNPLSLFYDKLTITQIDAQGVEIDNVLSMLHTLGSSDSEEALFLDYALVLNASHFDINPYVYEGVKFSSFVFETGMIKVDKDLTLNSEGFYLKFDSDISNVEVNGKVEDSVLLIDDLKLKNISAEDIRRLTVRLQTKYQAIEVSNTQQFMPIKDIQIEHILGTMKAVQYGDLKIKGAKLDLYEGRIDPYNNFTYQVKRADFRGETNFGVLKYDGYIKNSQIEAEGNIFLNKLLFTQYELPLNFKEFKKLPSTLRLNHDAVWIDIEHNAKKILALENDFNIDSIRAKHKLHYDYETEILDIKSKLFGSMTYADEFILNNEIYLDEDNFSYKGDVKVQKTKALPAGFSDYLLSALGGKFKGDSETFDMNLTSELLLASFKMEDYSKGVLALKSKAKNIELNHFIEDLPLAINNEKMAFESKSSFDFKNFNNSQILFDINTNILDINTIMTLEKPYRVTWFSKIKNTKRLREMFPKVKFSKLQVLDGDILLEDNNHIINIYNNFFKLFMKYDPNISLLKKAQLILEGERFNLLRDQRGNLSLISTINNIETFLEKIKSYYDVKLPNIRGEADIRLIYEPNGTLNVHIKSPKLEYVSDKKVTNFYSVDFSFSIDESANIVLDEYQFKLDDNGYLNTFYSMKQSYLSLKDTHINISQFWLNDEVEISGAYDVEKQLGNLKVDSKAYTFRTKDFTLILGLKAMVKIDKNQFNIEGDINILGDTIRYEVVGTDIVEDSDIIIIQDQVQVKASLFNNFKLYLKVKSTKPLKYITENINVEFLNEVSILKNYNQEMLITGMSTITKGYYELEDKRFTLDKSHLYFTGDIKKPLLDIKANYEQEQYTIHIFISGTTDNPIVNFNSEPFLTQQEILSLILFDGTGSSSGKGAEAYTILGGTFAKGLIKSLGISVDHLLLGTDADEEFSLEIGKKISDDVSVLYLHKDGLDGVKVRLEHSKNFETDIIIQPPNTSSIEFLYKQDR
ncbi:MAG: Unknown protein [uncultured Sulfurovum sp.]|uniref:Translocation and assembly module TamB C-terminal domain-containing protein n=1 Tax=uncultured Sulfurovum sp. TaxID=269237 RepID=A0A6S6S576_9BACT|nr:MAG: Unknown protein [uncultured Sulfurovum sp.]